jgi:hypothetical protein
LVAGNRNVDSRVGIFSQVGKNVNKVKTVVFSIISSVVVPVGLVKKIKKNKITIEVNNCLNLKIDTN